MQETIHSTKYFFSNDSAITASNFNVGIELKSNEVASVSGGVGLLFITATVLNTAILVATLGKENALKMMVGGVAYGVASVIGVAVAAAVEMNPERVRNIMVEKFVAVMSLASIMSVTYNAFEYTIRTSPTSFFKNSTAT